ncbi:MAG: hypothetical protein NZ958_07470 [Bacteroidia bacterium]|nr:hypothetical protein [Bacteroidia bacterium]MDW8088677.1 hypothetical protein [Bacteroidia bacterium]
MYLLWVWLQLTSSDLPKTERLTFQELRCVGAEGKLAQRSAAYLQRWKNKEVTPDNLRAIPLGLQRLFLEEGYLYAAVVWRRFGCTGGHCGGVLEVTPGPLVRLDTILIRGRWPAPRRAFYQITGLQPGQPLRLPNWEALPRKLRQNPYASPTDTPQLWLFPNLAWVEVALQPKQGNRVDGALALVPTSSQRAQVIGSLEVSLLSPFRLGERLEARYAQLPNNAQRLQLFLGLPYVWKGFLELRGRFLLWRQDTAFLQREVEAETRLRLTPSLRSILGLRHGASRPIGSAFSSLRPLRGFQRIGAKIGWEYERLDQRLSPHRGYFLFLVGTQGRLTYLPFPPLDLPLRTASFQEFHGQGEAFLPLGRLLTLRLGGVLYRYTSTSSYENELPRLGGEVGLRGFPENTFPAQAALQGYTELRLHTEEAGYFSVFAEGGQLFLLPSIRLPNYTLGLALQTQLAAGILRLTLATGRRQGTPWDWRRSLVRLEWVSEF